MKDRNSQNVRLKEEIVRALGEFVRPGGSSQQHVVSVGAWFFMCLPAELRLRIGDAFYEWCKTSPPRAFIPRATDPLLNDIIRLIEEKCETIRPTISREDQAVREGIDSVIREDMGLSGPPPDRKKAAEQVGAAARKLAHGRKRRPDKAQKTA